MSDDLNLIPRRKPGEPRSKASGEQLDKPVGRRRGKPGGEQLDKPGGRKRGKQSGKQRGDQPGKRPGKQVEVPKRNRLMDVATLAVLAAAFLPWSSAGSSAISGFTTAEGKLLALLAGIGFLLASFTVTGKFTSAINTTELVLAILADTICASRVFGAQAGYGAWIGLLASVLWVWVAIKVILQSRANAKKG